jgi:para-aminobenzoate synthetase component 1
VIFESTDVQLFKQKALAWAATFDTVCYLDSNDYADPYGKFDTLIAIGAKDEITSNSGDSFTKIEDFRRKNSGFIAGFFGYDLKNEVENLSSDNPDGLHFPDLYFFAPQIVITINKNTMEIIAMMKLRIFKQVERFELSRISRPICKHPVPFQQGRIR